MNWLTVLVASVGTYLLKLLGLLVPEKVLEHPRVRRITTLMPVALLAALIVMQTFSSGSRFTLDARAAGLAAALVAVLLKAPFLVVVVAACATTALVRLLL
ncbi:MAG: AzlD domain-containing protein [Streptosporangiales bacterium]|nr:AzlD domain-containing protein [Streptosporangiales bacterium]